MIGKIKTIKYRKDIDGMRAFSVLAVILFHMGFLPNGYLGVDVFFVISGYLITKIVFAEALAGNFEIVNFYLRRIRRIIPLVLFTSTVALIVGLFVMLPDDLKSLAQSVIATNFFSNNILLLITTKDYWNLINELKPLMHTWSLGVEEQFYLLYPVLFFFLNGKRTKYILPVLTCLAILSILFYFYYDNEGLKFYSIQCRFFEVAIGGVGAILFVNKKIKFYSFSTFAVFTLLAMLLIVNIEISQSIKLFLVVFLTILLLLLGETNNNFNRLFLENKFLVFLGKISFSLYMWHQIVLAYIRYFIDQKIGIFPSVIAFLFILLLSVFSYYLIEVPFRNKSIIKTKSLLAVLTILFVALSLGSFYIVYLKGIIRDVPELELCKNSHSINEKKYFHAYNGRVFSLNRDFTLNDKPKILVIGDSFSRDFTNILLESHFKDSVQISYNEGLLFSIELQKRMLNADVIFFSNKDYSEISKIKSKYKITGTQIFCLGLKNFGSFQGNGYFYNKSNEANYCNQTIQLNKDLLNRNAFLRKQWNFFYIDLTDIIAVSKNEVPIFTPDCKFISPDGVHLTQAGAKFYAGKLDVILKKKINKKVNL